MSVAAAVPAIISAIIAAIGVAVSIAGTVQATKAQQNAAKARQRQAKVNERIRELQADDSLARTRQKLDAHRRRVAIELGFVTLQQGISGTQLNVGTNVLQKAQVETYGFLDAKIIEQNGVREAYYLRVGAQNQRYAGDVAAFNLEQQAIGTAITGGASTLNRATGLLDTIEPLIESDEPPGRRPAP